ncbi:MAG: hypothetical protein ACYC36_03710 [Bellilinea sp.]
MERRIVCAAIRNDKGDIICGVRHFDVLMGKQIDNTYSLNNWAHDVEQGFVDNKGEFLSRTDAWKVAWEAKQVLRRVGGDEKCVLYSENIY